MSARRTVTARRLMVVALMILAIYAGFGLLSSHSANERLMQTQQDLREINRIVGEIKRLEHVPKVASLQFESPAEIANRVAAAMRDAGLPESNLMKEEPSAPQRIQRTDFEIRSTAIDLAPATLDQILRFCDRLSDPDTGTTVRDLTLLPPRNEEVGGGEERWEAQMVLTQTIFSPKSE